MRPDPRSLEYASILKRAAREGWLRELVAAHLTPCDELEARRILAGMRLFWKPELPRSVKLLWGCKRGRARFHILRGYGISLPRLPLDEGGRLRAGLVLHEAAHVLDHLTTKRFGHGPTYCRVLRDLVTNSDWRIWQMARYENMREIYARHRGPFTLMVTREREEKGRKVQSTETLKERFSAEDAHEESRLMVNRTNDNILDVYVFSATEGQFIGACYKRGDEFRSWTELGEPIIEEASDPFVHQVAAEVAPEPGEVVIQKDPWNVPAEPPAAEPPAAEPPAAAPAAPTLMEDARQAMTPKEKKPRQAPAPRKRVALELDPGNAERWPNSEAAQLVRSEIEAGPVTATELAERISERCKALGVAHPASLISRLKQAGLLRQVE
jgi:hypothetical protein